MGCASCKKAQSYETAKDLALKITQVWQSDVIIFKQYIHGVGYTYGYQRADQPVEKRCEQIEVVQFSQYQGSKILPDNIGQELAVVEQTEDKPKSTKRKSGSTVIRSLGTDTGEV